MRNHYRYKVNSVILTIETPWGKDITLEHLLEHKLEHTFKDIENNFNIDRLIIGALSRRSKWHIEYKILSFTGKQLSHGCFPTWITANHILAPLEADLKRFPQCKIIKLNKSFNGVNSYVRLLGSSKRSEITDKVKDLLNRSFDKYIKYTVHRIKGSGLSL